MLLQLQGDANANPDTETYPVAGADRVVAHVGHLGYVVDALASPYAVFAAGAGTAGLLALGFRRRPEDPDTTGTPGMVIGAGAAAVCLGLVTGVTALGGGTVTPTLAAFSDTAQVTGAAGTLTVPAPASIDCTNGEFLSGRVYVGWPAVPGASSRYLLEVRAPGAPDPVRTYEVTTARPTGRWSPPSLAATCPRRATTG